MTFIHLLRLTDEGLQAIQNQKQAFEEVRDIIQSNGGDLKGA